jgi:hypothetical protein
LDRGGGLLALLLPPLGFDAEAEALVASEDVLRLCPPVAPPPPPLPLSLLPVLPLRRWRACKRDGEEEEEVDAVASLALALALMPSTSSISSGM